MPTPRKSLSEHELQSTKPRYVEPDSSIAPGRPKYPKGLTPEAKKVFKAACHLLERRRSLTEADGELIRLLALTHVRHARAIEKLALEGEVRMYTRLDSNGQPHEFEKENLWLQIARDAEKQMIGIFDRLGVTPLNRGKVKPTKAEPKADAAAMPTRDETTLPEDEVDLNSIDETLIVN
jgi:P27 family predicted phage terminase small subunit